MKFPLDYKDVTVAQYEALQLLKQKSFDLYIDYIVAKLSILSGERIEEIEEYSPKEVYLWGSQTIYADIEMPNYDFKEVIKIGNKEFKFTEVLTVAQERDVTEFIKGKIELSRILAVIFKEKTKEGFKYISENHFENAKLFKQAKIKDISGAVFFYTKNSKTYENNLLTSLELSMKPIKEIEAEMLNDKAFQDFLNNGGLIIT